ncbi:hypothetical protein DVW06_11135 [Enterococcus sp. ARL09-542]|uniref:YopX family protein n=1 Tax=Enterococcus sp. ARL09-542 TaxID=2233534 RepID=UPI0010C1D123|nr:YopX family protein [Enterococcus sp. ARL09-542]TKL05312.1 hypothetical protein DVW06_11135 [Enterococcus sp. ARL09-542]
MSKIPKFRAWQKYHKRMVEVTSISFDDNGEINGVGTFAENQAPQYINYSDELLGRFFLKDERGMVLELMQSTGLKDKNGVEIFEGDIVSVRNHPFQKTEKSGAGIEIDGDYAISWNEGDLTWCAGNLLLARLKPYVTVAGNIYENPELLEQANES